MKTKYLLLAGAALLVAGGLWLARSRWDMQDSPRSSRHADPKMTQGPPKPGQAPRPPDQSRRFRDFTPEQRVEFARKGHGPGG